MIFDEQKYSSLLGSIDLSEYKIKKISNYMTYFVDNANSICKIWKNYFYFTKSNEIKLALVYLLNDVFEDTVNKKNNVFIIEFGDILKEVFSSFAEVADEIETVRKLMKLISLWESKMFYSYNFANGIYLILKEKEKKLYEKDPRLKLRENIEKEMLNKVISNLYTKKYFELNIKEKNIKNIYDEINVNFDKVNNVLINDQNMHLSVNAKSIIKELEDKIRNLRNCLIKDLCKREFFIGESIDNLNKEKEIYFKFEEDKK